MRDFFKKRLQILIYILLMVIVICRVAVFHMQSARDRKAVTGNERTYLECTVISVPACSNGAVSFFARCTKGAKLKTYSYVYITRGSALKLCPGDRLSLYGEISLPSGPMNPGGYDFAGYLRYNGASTAIYSDISSIKNHTPSATKGLYSLRSKITENTFRYLPEREAALVNALVTGSKNEMSENQKESFRRAGVYHVIAVSGLHLGMLLMFIAMIYINPSFKKRIHRILQVVLTLIACGFLFAFTGMGVSVERTALMAIILSFAGVMYREYSPFISLYIVFALVLIAEPYVLTDVAMQLSFSATCGVLAGTHILKKYNLSGLKWAYIAETAVLTQCANLFTLPFTVYHFGSISTVGMFSNLLVLAFIPVLLSFSYIFAIISSFAPAFITNIAANIVFVPAYAVNAVTDFFAGIPYGYITLTIKELSIAVFVAVCIIGMLKVRSRRMRYGILCLFIIANIGFVSYNTLRSPVTVSFMNVGQGDCTIIEDSAGAAYMIDCGSDSTETIAEREIIPYLKSRGIRKIDILFITHYHTDHINGVISLIEQGFVKELAVPDRGLAEDEKVYSDMIYKASAVCGIPIHHLSKEDVIKSGKHRFEVLHPYSICKRDANNSSLAISYTYGKTSIIFPADNEAEGQYMMLSDLYDCDILKAPHHGGKSTMSDKVYAKTTPDYTVISCAKNNRYNHPSKDTLSKFKDSNILRTDLTGGPIVFKLRKDRLIWKQH